MESIAKLHKEEPTAERLRVISAVPGAELHKLQRLPGGRSNQVWRCGRVVVKFYQACSATPLFPNDIALEAAALDALAPMGLAPKPLARGQDWLAWRHLGGTSWQGEAGISALLLKLSRAPAFAGLEVRPMGARAIAGHAQSFAPPQGLPSLPDLVDVVLPKPSLLHGDLVPGNIICTENGLSLIDWQCPALGDPVDDLALFLSPAMQWLYRGRTMEPGERTALLSELPDALRTRYTLLAPILHWRIAAHCAYRALRGDADYDLALRLELASEQLTQ